MSNLTLSVKDRILLRGMLPKTAGRITMTLINDILNQVDFTPAEITEFKLQDTASGAVLGDPKCFTDIKIELSAPQIIILKEIGPRMDNDKTITREMLPLLDKIDTL